METLITWLTTELRPLGAVGWLLFVGYYWRTERTSVRVIQTLSDASKAMMAITAALNQLDKTVAVLSEKVK